MDIFNEDKGISPTDTNILKKAVDKTFLFLYLPTGK